MDGLYLNQIFVIAPLAAINLRISMSTFFRNKSSHFIGGLQIRVENSFAQQTKFLQLLPKIA